MRSIVYGHARLENEHTGYWLEYHILVTEIYNASGNPLCESYGVSIRLSEDGADGYMEVEELHDLTTSLSGIESFCELLRRNLVTPSTLREVAEDYLAG